jgi:mannose-6-phosphate isomerase
MVNTIRKYDWGSVTEIPRLTGIENRAGEPMAELWMGAHPSAPSRVRENGEMVPLTTFLEEHPQARLGKAVAERFGENLPFLFKILSAARPLSIQAHPNLNQARAGFAREEAAGISRNAYERSYRDANHKPEIIRALTEFWALRGFRSHTEITDELGADEFGFLAAPLRRLRREPGPDALESVFEAVMTADAVEVSEAARAHAERRLRSAGGKARARYEWVLRLHAEFGADRGVAAPLYLNCLRLEPGEAMFLPAGTLHAYLSGTGIELMANSDNVLRGGLTNKHVDVAELIRTLAFEPDEPELQRAPVDHPGTWHRFSTPASEFTLEEAAIDGALTREREPGSPEIVLVIEGTVRLEERDRASVEALEVRGGASAFVTADTGTYSLSGEGQLFVASVPREGST